MKTLGALILLLMASTAQARAPRGKGHPETRREKAVHLVDALFDRYHAQITSLTRACVTIVEPDDLTGRVVEFELREKHDAVCGGDPEVAPRITTLKVDLKTGKGERSDATTGEFVPLK
jgi:hypothetical protein